MVDIVDDGKFVVSSFQSDERITGLIPGVIVRKPWGEEHWLTYNRLYALKVLIVHPGSRFSLQHHDRKVETWHILEGQMDVTYGDSLANLKSQTFPAGITFHIAQKTIHRVENKGRERLVFLEVSTPELDDVIRHADDFGRQ